MSLNKIFFTYQKKKKNLLWNSYFENLTIELHVLYVFNIHVNWMLFTI